MFHVEQIILPIGEIRDRFVARLKRHLGKINAPPKQPRRRAGLKTPEFKPKFLQRPGQPHRCRLPSPAPRLLVGPNVHQAPQKCSGRDDHRSAMIFHFQCRLDSIHDTVLVQNLGDLALFNIQIRLSFANPLEPKLVSLLVALRAGCPNRRSFLGVEHPKLQAGHVGCLAHFSADRINLACQMAFG